MTFIPNQKQARKDQAISDWIKAITEENRSLREALKGQLGLNDEELEEWLIDNYYKEQ